MNAALSRDRQRVEFVWDSTDADGAVRMYNYDYAKDTKPQAISIETRENARQWWRSLLVSGYDRIHEPTEPKGFLGYPLNLSL